MTSLTVTYQELSGGQIQRVLLARAVISKPDIVILDEPNTYIDLRFQSQTYEMLKSINGECAVVVVGHDIDALLKNARNIVCVNHSAEQYDAKKHIAGNDKPMLLRRTNRPC